MTPTILSVNKLLEMVAVIIRISKTSMQQKRIKNGLDSITVEDSKFNYIRSLKILKDSIRHDIHNNRDVRIQWIGQS